MTNEKKLNATQVKELLNYLDEQNEIVSWFTQGKILVKLGETYKIIPITKNASKLVNDYNYQKIASLCAK